MGAATLAARHSAVDGRGCPWHRGGMDAEAVIEALSLAPLAKEGGWYRETYRSTLPWAGPGGQTRSTSTAIYYLLRAGEMSALHRLAFDEVFHFYAGAPVDVTLLDPESGALETRPLGPDWTRGQMPQLVVPAHWWQALRIQGDGAWTLMGTTVAPGFDWADFSLATEELLARFPAHRGRLAPLLPQAPAGA